jgi:hypothetical protein
MKFYYYKNKFVNIDAEDNKLNISREALELIKNNKIDVIHFEFNEMDVYSRVFLEDLIQFINHTLI